ncbi:MAG TPA: prepilin-type N-terminal cleavage/methylation domain-containing protein [Verrucomicrobiae bacterium]
MRADTKLENSPRRRFIAVYWQDCRWQPRIEVRPAAPPPDVHSPRRNFILQKTMKTTLPRSRRHRAGFTLVELLTVIAIIGILAALLLTVLAAAKRSALKAKAQTEIQGLATAIQGYDSAYGRFPVSPAAQAAAGANAGNAASQNGDFTYGGTFQSPTTPNIPQSVGTLVNGSIMSNAEVIAILMNLTNYPGGGATVNANYQKNPQQTVFLSARMSGDTSSPGVGTDLVYRDPWGNPYVITMDLNYDELCEDAFYGLPTVSNNNLTALIKAPDDNYAYRGKVMVWSAGSDGAIDKSNGAGTANKDNVLSWQ